MYQLFFFIKNNTTIKKKENNTKKHNKKGRYESLIPNPTQQQEKETSTILKIKYQQKD